MGTCHYCGQPAGFLRSKHSECAEKYRHGWTAMIDLARTSALGDSIPDNLEAQLVEIGKDHYVPDGRAREALVSGWEKAVEHFLEDGKLDRAEEEGSAFLWLKRTSMGKGAIQS